MIQWLSVYHLIRSSPSSRTFTIMALSLTPTDPHDNVDLQHRERHWIRSHLPCRSNGPIFLPCPPRTIHWQSLLVTCHPSRPSAPGMPSYLPRPPFKVASRVPSRYLFAINLSPVFSLGRNLTPDLGCIPKQLNSLTTSRGDTRFGLDRALTLLGIPFLEPGLSLRMPLHTTIRGVKPPILKLDCSQFAHRY